MVRIHHCRYDYFLIIITDNFNVPERIRLGLIKAYEGYNLEMQLWCVD